MFKIFAIGENFYRSNVDWTFGIVKLKNIVDFIIIVTGGEKAGFQYETKCLYFRTQTDIWSKFINSITHRCFKALTFRCFESLKLWHFWTFTLSWKLRYRCCRNKVSKEFFQLAFGEEVSNKIAPSLLKVKFTRDGILINSRHRKTIFLRLMINYHLAQQLSIVFEIIDEHSLCKLFENTILR